MKPNASFRLAGCCLSGVLLLFLSGCAGSPPWGAWSKSPTPAQLRAALAGTPETFIYFSRYEVYQNERTKEYVYQDGHWWIHSALPPVTIEEATLKQSPAVVVALEESPERSHGQIRETYPSDWNKPPTIMASNP